MPELLLTPHPSTPGGPARSISADARLRAPGSVAIRYRAKGLVGEIKIPPVEEPARADELWRHTCFEAFFGLEDSSTYFEFNFSPSGLWAAYGFSSYREGMRVLTACAPPTIEVLQSARTLTLTSVVNLDCLGVAIDSSLRIGFSAVIEDNASTKTYWALAHPSAKPDFHHPDSFVFNLKKADRS